MLLRALFCTSSNLITRVPSYLGTVFAADVALEVCHLKETQKYPSLTRQHCANFQSRDVEYPGLEARETCFLFAPMIRMGWS